MKKIIHTSKKAQDHFLKINKEHETLLTAMQQQREKIMRKKMEDEMKKKEEAMMAEKRRAEEGKILMEKEKMAHEHMSKERDYQLKVKALESD